MTDKKTLAKVFTFSLLLAVLSMSWFVFNIIVDIDLVFREVSCQFALVLAFLSFFISIVFLRKLLVSMRRDINRRNEKERNIRDFHQYRMLLDPPTMNN